MVTADPGVPRVYCSETHSRRVKEQVTTKLWWQVKTVVATYLTVTIVVAKNYTVKRKGLTTATYSILRAT